MSASTAEFAVRLGDDALITGQRLCEWVSNAPMLEEDLALSNVALDYLGRARMLYGYAGQLTNQTEDDFAYGRDARDFRNLLMFELPRGDFAFGMARQYFLDVFEHFYFGALIRSQDSELAAVAAKTEKEIRYHQRRSREWMLRLALGTDESRRRLESAVDELWGYVAEFFLMDELETELVQQGIGVDRAELKPQWISRVETLFAEIDMPLPTYEWRITGGRTGMHTEHLGHLLSEMQFLQRTYPGLNW